MVRLLAPFALLLLAGSLLAQPEPRDIFREYRWRPQDKWQRVTGPDATDPGAKAFLPNPVNEITIDDLALATRIEVQIEKLQSHAGTRYPRLRVNGNAWHEVPEPRSAVIPGSAGLGGFPWEYLTMRYPIVQVPLTQLKTGKNTFEFDCSSRDATMLGRTWPQWLCYGVTFRVYYQHAKPHPTGTISAPAKQLGADPVFSVSASGPNPIAQVDVLGDYDDFNWRGDGEDLGWQHAWLYGALTNHIGTTTQSPWQVRWDTTWVPLQTRPFRVCARVTDTAGLTYVTPAIDGLTLRRNKTVVRYRSTAIPSGWQSRANGTHSCQSTVNDDLSKAEAARIFMVTWNGMETSSIGINSTHLLAQIGKWYDIDYSAIDLNPALVRAGANTLYTSSNTEHHGIEVQWPGMELFVRYSVSEGDWVTHLAELQAFGSGCPGTGGQPGDVLPADYRRRFGESYSALPQATPDVRYQQVFLGSDLPKATSWSGIGLRQDEQAVSNGGGSANWRIRIGYTSKTPATMSSTFEANFDLDPPVTVFDGSFSMPSLAGRNVNPDAFAIGFPFPSSFHWQPQAGRNLCLEIVHQGGSRLDTWCDAVSAAGAATASAWAWSRSAATADVVAPGHGAAVQLRQFSGPGRAAPFTSSAQRPLLGRTYAVDLTDGKPSTIGVIATGVSDSQWGPYKLPFDFTSIGAPGCSLLISLDFLQPFLARADGGYSLPLPLPNNATWSGITLYHQYILFDQGANPTWLSFSNALRARFGLW
jgi:hypothetical protein